MSLLPSIKYPVGIQSFPIIIEGEYLYIDKTRLAWQLANTFSYVYLSRPRRFGKSLLISTLQAYFEGRKELFLQNLEGQKLGYAVRTEVHSSQGRSDIEIETPGYIYIIELKIDSTPEDAMAQIQDRGYARQYEINPRPKILIGANFSTEPRTLTGWTSRASHVKREGLRWAAIPGSCGCKIKKR